VEDSHAQEDFDLRILNHTGPVLTMCLDCMNHLVMEDTALINSEVSVDTVAA